MSLHTYYLIENACYKEGKTITPKGIMVHSTGFNNPWLKSYIGPNDGLLGENVTISHWNTESPDGREVCVHAFIGRLGDGSVATYQTLPWEYRAWHSGSGENGSANDTHISIEICEDDLSSARYFNEVYKEATRLCAFLCRAYCLKPETIICHSEGYEIGIATNHNDVMHWFPKYGKSMDTFRTVVQKLIYYGRV